MQAFQFAKQLLLQLRAQKQQWLASGDVTASKDQPIRLILRAEADYDADKANPLRKLHLTCGGADASMPVREYTLDIPKEVQLRREQDIEQWLRSVFEFVANAHGVALRRVEKSARKEEKDVPQTQVFIQPNRWELTWRLNAGVLSQCPVEAAGVQMDRLMQQCLDGWKSSSKDAKMMVRPMRSLRSAEEAKELLHLLLEINGCTDKELRKDIVIKPVGEHFMLKMPKRHYELAVQAEQYLGY